MHQRASIKDQIPMVINTVTHQIQAIEEPSMVEGEGEEASEVTATKQEVTILIKIKTLAFNKIVKARQITPTKGSGEEVLEEHQTITIEGEGVVNLIEDEGVANLTKGKSVANLTKGKGAASSTKDEDVVSLIKDEDAASLTKEEVRSMEEIEKESSMECKGRMKENVFIIARLLLCNSFFYI